MTPLEMQREVQGLIGWPPPIHWIRLEHRGEKRSRREAKARAEKEAKEKAEAGSGEVEMSEAVAPLPDRFEGNCMAKTSDETLDSFLERLVPSKASSSEHHYIRIANPQAGLATLYGEDRIEIFCQEARQLLETNDPSEVDLESRDILRLKNDIIHIAARHDIDGGKWIVPLSKDRRDEMWKEVAKKTYNDQLGSAASISLEPVKDQTYLLFIHYSNSWNRVEVERLSGEIWKMSRLWREPGVSTIHYKQDAFGLLQINSGNRWGIRTPSWSSHRIDNRIVCHFR